MVPLYSTILSSLRCFFFFFFFVYVCINEVFIFTLLSVPRRNVWVVVCTVVLRNLGMKDTRGLDREVIGSLIRLSVLETGQNYESSILIYCIL